MGGVTNARGNHMKILMFTHEFAPYPGGIGRYALEMARAAVRAGHQVSVVAPDYGQRRETLKDEEEGFTVYRQKAGLYRTSRLPAMMMEVMRFVAKEPWDVIHAADLPYAIALGASARLRPLRFQCTAHGTDVISLSESGSAKLMVKGDPYALCARVACNSEFTREMLHANFPALPAEKSLVTHLGVSSYWFAEPTRGEVDLAARHLEKAKGVKIVLTLARLEERKGHLLTLEALDRLWQRGIRDFCYVIAGTAIDREYHERLQVLAAAAPFPVILTGKISESDVRALYRLARVFCLPALAMPRRVEGFGLAYLEAAAQGTPAVGFRSGAVGEVVQDQQTGLLIPEGDVEALSHALEKLLTDDSLHASMGKQGRDWAAKFTWDKCAGMTFTPLEKAMRSPAPSAPPEPAPIAVPL